MIVTPDYGLSDIWHFNYPLKNLLGESLKQGRLPWWTDQVGNGFPIAAEGQIGAFSPINWMIFGIFPMPAAFTMAQMVAFLIMATGSYLFARSLRLSRTISIAALAFASYNGYIIAQLTHLNLLQSFSFIPWAFWLLEKIISTRRKMYGLWLAMILAQMILVGYPQTFFNSVIMLGVYALVRSFSGATPSGVPTETPGRTMAFVGASAVGAVLLAAIQVLPLVELVDQSDTVAAAANQRFIHPLSPKHLLTAIDPFIFGDPSQGTYPVYGEDWGMFWENMFYIGMLPIVVIALSILKRKFPGRSASGVTVVLLASLLLSLGKYSPVSFLFKLPPLSFTRISSRFLVFSNFSLGIFAALCLGNLVGKKKFSIKVIYLVAIMHFIQVSWTFRNYHLWVDSQRWLLPPEIASQLPQDSRIISFGQSERWNSTYLTDGWQDKETTYYQNRNSLDPNSNMIFGVRQLGVYAQQLPKRQELVQRNMYQDSILGENIRTVFGVTYAVDARSDEFQIIKRDAALPDIRIGQNIITVKDSGEALGRMNQASFNPRADVLWESEVMPGEDSEVIVINRSFYPGWNAFISGKKISIYPVNINQQAVIVPRDTDLSTISFKYDPISFKLGAIISSLSFAGWMLLWVKFRYNSAYGHRH